MIGCKKIFLCSDSTNWDEVYEFYGDTFRLDIEKLKNPTVMDEITTSLLQYKWEEVCRIVREELPTPEEILNYLV